MPPVLLGGWCGPVWGGLPLFFVVLPGLGSSADWPRGPVFLAGCLFGFGCFLLVWSVGWWLCFGRWGLLCVPVFFRGFFGPLWLSGLGGFCGRGLFLAGWWGCCGRVVAVWVLVVVAFGGFAVVVGGFWLGVGVAPLSGARPWLALRARVAFLSFCRHRLVFGCPGHCALCHSSHRVSFYPFVVLVVTLDMIPVIAPFYYSGHCVPLLSTLVIVLNIVLVITPFVTLVGPLLFFFGRYVISSVRWRDYM